MTTEMIIEFPGGPKRVDTHIRGFTVKTDSSIEGGGEGLAPSPGAIFLAGLGSCTASTGRTYCRTHGFPIPEQVKAIVHSNPETGVVERIEFEFIVPEGFPEDHLEALTRAAGACDVKKMWQNVPEFSATARINR